MADRDDGAPRLTPRIVLGLAVMGFGLVLTLGQVGLVVTREWLRFWPAVLILFGLACLVESPSAWRRPRGYVWALVGTGLLLDNLDLLDVSRFVFPALLILIGGSILRTGGGRRCSSEEESGRRLSGLALLGGVSRKSTTDDFRGGEFAALMGGVEIDLRDAVIREGQAEIEAFAFWGGVEIWVPHDWQVVSKGVAVLGGFEDNTRSNPDATQRLVVRGMAIMGGVEVKNKDPR